MSIMNAISGLTASSHYINVISNNIANASTIGFKSSTLSFCDIISPSLNASIASGSGVKSGNLIQNFNDGTLINTGRNLDLGIRQHGFFRVLDSNGQIYYTRNGQFFIDKNQNIVNTQGMYLTGENDISLRANINYVHYVGPINFKKNYELEAKATTRIALSPVLNDQNKNFNNNRHSANYNTSLTIYDNHKKPQKMVISFNKKTNTENTWEMHINSKNNTDKSYDNNIDSVFNIVFDSSGNLKSPSIFPVLKKNKNSLLHPIIIDLSGIQTNSNESSNNLNKVFQDGYPSGILKTFDVLKTGEIKGTYSNEQKKTIGQIMLASFMNPDKLQPEGTNLWSATHESGKEQLSIGDNREFGTITKKSLESSNVDLNKELINMIVAQRNYQSNAQVLKTEDKMIGTLVNLR